MVTPKCTWELMEPDEGAVRALASALGAPEPVAKVLVNRGVDSPGNAGEFLNPSADRLHDPFLLSGMESAVERMKRAIGADGKVLVVGDYDVDGVSGTALLVSCLRRRGVRAQYYIPDRRTEGYGISCEVVRKAKESGYSLLAAVDSGTTAFEEARLAAEMGLDMIILDHHEPRGGAPDGAAVVNPKLADDPYPFRDLAAVGVVFKFVQALASASGESPAPLFEEFADVVALGTVADLMPLLGENRILVAHGLPKIEHGKNPGIAALMSVSGFSPRRRVDTHHVSFGLAPRINAAGRVWNPRAGVELLLTPDPARAREIAGRLDEKNRERMKEEEAIMKGAAAMLERDFDAERDRSVVLFNEKWHVGVIGIVASRIVDAYYAPVIIFTASGRKEDAGDFDRGRVCIGSARSIREINICRVLEKTSDLLLDFGGHSMAAGLKIHEGAIPEFRRRLNDAISEEYGSAGFKRKLILDGVLKLNKVSLSLVEQMEAIEPCGVGNPRPVFCSQGVTVLESRTCGSGGKHLKMRVGQGTTLAEAIGFNMASAWDAEEIYGETLDITYTLREDNYMNHRTVTLQLKDMRKSDPSDLSDLPERRRARR
ncbi:MAG: single-stranded-DNA-specific exonuclease RecJ [bacterium]